MTSKLNEISLLVMSKRTLRNLARSEHARADRYERLGGDLAGTVVDRESKLQTVEVERNELRDRQMIVITMIEAELGRQKTLVQTVQCREETAFLEGLLKAFRPSRLTPEAWEGQEIN